MFDEELAQRIGIAYAVYVSICKANGKHAMGAETFMYAATDCIEQIRDVAGLVTEKSFTD